MTDASILFEPFSLKNLELANRVTMAPLFLGYAGADGFVNDMLLDHYREMGGSGAGLIVVENAVVDQRGAGSPFTIRGDDDVFIPGLEKLAGAIRDGGARAVLQINHAGRFAFPNDRLAPSPVAAGGVIPREMNLEEIGETIAAYASAARRVRDAGFDGVEIHGGTGYLLVQFLSPRTNQRTDEYGGSLENRMRFPLAVMDAVKRSVGPDFPIGYRFLADEYMPGGYNINEAVLFARTLAERKPAYLSVMVGTYDSFFLPEYKTWEKEEGYMARYAGRIREAIEDVPVIAAGRIQSPAVAEHIIESGQADLVGLARVLLADPLWPRKAADPALGEIISCEPTCMLCMKRVMSGRPAFCSQWPRERRQAFLKRIGEKEEETENL